MKMKMGMAIQRETLVNEIISFCYEYELFGKSVREDLIRKVIEERLEESEFIENLINTIIVKTKNREDIDVQNLKELLLELEKVRLELEYKE